jgi:hypothetical protein
MSKKKGIHVNPEGTQSRREFLLRAGTMAGGLMAADLAGLFRNHPSAADNRSYAAAKFALELDGVSVGFIHSFGGGDARSEVIAEKPQGSNPFVNKHASPPRYEAITIACGAGMEKPFYDWIKASISGMPPGKNGAIVTMDYNNKPTRRLEFKNALITEVGFPALDGASKDPAYLAVKFAPQYTQKTLPGGAIPIAAKPQKTLLPSNFALKIKGLEQACVRVSRIEALTIRKKTAANPVGDMRIPQQESAGIEIPNVVLTVSEGFAAPFYAWHEDFVIKGNNGDAQERPGVLEFLAPDRTVLFTLSLFNLGIISAAQLPVVTADALSRAKVEMYCERIDFDAGPVGTAATQVGATPAVPAKGIPPPPARSAPPVGAPGMLSPSPLQRQPLK